MNAAQQCQSTPAASFATLPSSLLTRPAAIALDHPIINFKIFHQDAGQYHFIPIVDIINWLHTGWRIRNQLLQLTRRLDLVGLLISTVFLYMNKEA
jgi:hypothetical protein